GSRAGRLLAVLDQEEPPGAVGLGADHLLLEHRGHQRLEDAAAAPDPEAFVAQRQVAHHRVAGGEPGPVVVEAEPAGQAVEQPGGAGPPGLPDDAARLGYAGRAGGARWAGGG